jgi:HK97 gp10 family phage protein
MISTNISLINVSSLPDLDQALSNASKEIGAFITSKAQLEHRFKNRSGNLKRSIQYTSVQNYVDVYINEAMAPYGQFVHSGTKYKSPDPFIQEAINKYSNELEAIFDKHIKLAIGN